MDTTITTSTQASFITNNWRSQKRIPEREFDFDHDDEVASATKDIESNHIKRFRSTAPSMDEWCKRTKENACQQPTVKVPATTLLAPKPIHAKNGIRLSENLKSEGLSPITEISQNMSETSLDSKCEEDGAAGGIGKEDLSNNDGGTPLRRCPNTTKIRTHKFSRFTQLLQGRKESDQEETSTETLTATNDDYSNEEQHQQHQLDKLNDVEEETSNNSDSGFQMPRNSSALRTGGLRRLNVTASLASSPSMHDNMAVDEFSFYDDETAVTQHRSLTVSPPLMGLLSPEGSPRRFQIVERPAIGAVAAATAALQKIHRKSSASLRQKTSQRSTLSSNGTPAKSFFSLSSGSGESTSLDDDEYMELFEMESLESQSQAHLNFPSDLSSLISGHIKHASSPVYSHGRHSNRKSNVLKTPEMRRPSVRRCLSMTENQQPTPKTPDLLSLKQVQETTAGCTTPLSSSSTNCFKRPEPPCSASNSPVLSKRYRCSDEDKENLNGSYTAKLEESLAISPAAATATATVPPARHTLRKSMSMNDAEILSALARSDSRDQPDLIGDFSKPFALPLMEGRHCDLKSISSDTVARLINGDYKDQVASYKIIDCRYPYEFEGGHIRGARNLYTQEQIIEEFITMQKTEQPAASGDVAGHKRNIIIFHCEFSSERGPKLSRFLRNHDRARNTNLYPALDYPEIYLLHNGYKEFYETHSELCDPVAYRPMLEPAFSEAYRHFRAKSKSWNGDGLGGGTARTMKKSRSRLML